MYVYEGDVRRQDGAGAPWPLETELHSLAGFLWDFRVSLLYFFYLIAFVIASCCFAPTLVGTIFFLLPPASVLIRATPGWRVFLVEDINMSRICSTFRLFSKGEKWKLYPVVQGPC